jgi:aldehyde dehydrogenase (NAD+)
MQNILSRLNISAINHGTSTGLQSWSAKGANLLESDSPVDGKLIAKVSVTTLDDYQKVMSTAAEAFKTWRNVPAPRRGEIVRQMGDAFRHNKEPLGQLVSYEMGKSLQEGLGEVQEIIDICDSTDSRCTPNVRNIGCMNSIILWELSVLFLLSIFPLPYGRGMP